MDLKSRPAGVLSRENLTPVLLKLVQLQCRSRTQALTQGPGIKDPGIRALGRGRHGPWVRYWYANGLMVC